MQDIKELTLEELEEELKSFGAHAYNARQIFSWIYKKGVSEFAQMSDLTQGLRDKLSKIFYISGLEIVKKLKSSDGTQKLLFKLKDGKRHKRI